MIRITIRIVANHDIRITIQFVMRIVAIDHDIRMVMRITDTDQEYEL